MRTKSSWPFEKFLSTMIRIMGSNTGRTILSLVLGVVLLLAIANAVLVLRSPNEHKYDPHISNVVRLYPVDPLLVRSVIWRESNFDPTILGRAQERGLMQVTPTAGREWAKSAKVDNFHEDDLYDPYTNIRAGTWYLTRALRRYADRDDPISFALAEYNAGRSNVLRWIDPENPMSGEAFMARMDYPSTRRYVETIKARYQYYQDTNADPIWKQWFRRWFHR